MSMRKDSCPRPRRPINGELLREAVTWAIQGKVFAHLQFHGNTTWQVLDLILLAVVWVWSGDGKLTRAFGEAHGWSMRVLGRAAVGTYQGLIKALVTWTGQLLPLIDEQFHRRMQEHGGEHWRVGRWLALAIDGSRTSVPRTKANEGAFCAPNYGKSYMVKYRRRQRRARGARRRSKNKPQPVKPQIWLTLLWHMGLHMPWSWKSAPSYASERDHFKALVRQRQFPENTWFCGDAGMTGYQLWRDLVGAGHSFLIRVGSNVRLLRQLGYVQERPGIVYVWPDKEARRQQPPLVLRLLCLHLGRCPRWLVTDVLDANGLTNDDAVRLYQLRWGVELQFRTVKQTFRRRKLCSKTPDRAYVELDWALLGLWLIQLFAVKEQIAIGAVPEDCSVSLAIHIIRTMLRHWSEPSEETLAQPMQRAQKDNYTRTKPKQGRYRPDQKSKPVAGKPKIDKATRKHQMWLEAFLAAAA